MFTKSRYREIKKEEGFKNQLDYLEKTFSRKSSTNDYTKVNLNEEKIKKNMSIRDSLILTALDQILLQVNDQMTIPKALE